jgi:hypothetical protein
MTMRREVLLASLLAALSTPNAVSLSEQIAFTAKGLLRERPGIPLFKFSSETNKRLLDYQVWPGLFWPRPLIIGLGQLGYLKDKRRQAESSSCRMRTVPLASPS